MAYVKSLAEYSTVAMSCGNIQSSRLRASHCFPTRTFQVGEKVYCAKAALSSKSEVALTLARKW